MRLLLLILPLLLFVSAVVPVAHAADIPLLDSSFHIVPDAHDLDASCPVGAPLSFGAVLEIIQRMMNAAISFGILIFVIIMTWGGFLMITSVTNPEARSTARGMLTNAAIGLLIVLSAWLIVDFVMKTLYSSTGEDTAGVFGPWNSILNGGKACVLATETKPLFSGPIQVSTLPDGTQSSGTSGSSGSTGNAGSGANCPAADPNIMVAFSASVTVGETEKATPQTVQNFLAMRAAALKDGVDLKVTDGYRSDAEQVSLWNQNCPGGICKKATAKPCSLGGNGSNHNSGQALDINVGCGNGNSGCNTKAYQWLKAHGAQWGFRNALPTDPVHWSPSGR